MGWATVVALSASLLGCSSGKSIQGAGSSFVKPVMDRWVAEYTKNKGGEINYQATGSGNGIDSMIARSVHFGATDAFMTDEQLKKAREAANGGEVLHLPLVMGGIVPAYNLEGIDKPLHFTGEVLADIYMGKITKWNDPKLQALNEGAKLPAEGIAVCGRSDSSGSTNIFTDYLSKVSPEFKEKVGVGTKVDWKVTGENGTSGVAGFLKKTANSLGYIELTYALQNKISYGAVKNQVGEFVLADLNTVKTAAENSLGTIPEDLRFSITNAPGKGAYPISGTTWAVVYVKQPKEEVAKALTEFFTWVIHDDGQKAAEKLHYAPLPAGLVTKIEASLQKITTK
jgi:phosphate transport system substrate-binding protein